MDYEAICSQDGYRREDLPPESRSVLEDIDYVINSIECLLNNPEDIDDECLTDSIIGKMKKEMFQKAINVAIEQARYAQMEIQIALAEKDC